MAMKWTGNFARTRFEQITRGQRSGRAQQQNNKQYEPGYWTGNERSRGAPTNGTRLSESYGYEEKYWEGNK
jgi:hypothetical protein